MGNQGNDSNQEPVHDLPSRREVLIAGAALVAAPFLAGVTYAVQAAQAANAGVPVDRTAHAQAGKVQGTATEWLSYSGDKASSKYSPLTQISANNFNRLRTAWTWRSAEEEVAKANPSRGHRRRDRQDPVDLRPGDVEERNSVQQRLRASRRRLLGRR